jgi:alcohol dehydrogenase (cytochrome c)
MASVKKKLLITAAALIATGAAAGGALYWAFPVRVSGWVYAVDADSGTWKWRLKSNYPIVGAMTPTAGGVVFFGDLGGNFYALDASAGQKLWGQDLGGAIAGGIITYMANGTQRIAVAAGFTHIGWPTKIVTAKVVVLGLDSTSASK